MTDTSAGRVTERDGSAQTTPQPKAAAWVALALATFAMVVGFAVWSLLAPLAPLFREQWGLSATEVGVLVAVPVILGSIARIPLGIVTDRYGGRIVFTVFLFFLAVPLVLAGFADGYAVLLAVAFILGVAGAVFAIGVPFVARWFPPARQGMALGIYGMGNIGTAIAALVAPPIASTFGWPFAFWVFVPVVLVMGALVFLFGRDAPGTTAGRIVGGSARAVETADRLGVEPVLLPDVRRVRGDLGLSPHVSR